MSATDHSAVAAMQDAAAYTLAEAARYARLPAATLRAWTLGRRYPTREGGAQFEPLIMPASQRPPLLSFSNLIEAHVLRALRTEHGVSVKGLRDALFFAQNRLGIERLLLSPELRTDAGKLFLDRYGELIELSASGQLAMRRLLDAHLRRLEWDAAQFPVRLYPFLSLPPLGDDRSIAIDPRIAFGRPVLLRGGVSTSTIAERLDAGESVEEIAADYDLGASDIEQAALYERAA